MKLSTLLLMLTYCAVSFIGVPFLTYAVAYGTVHLVGVNMAAVLACLTAIISVTVLIHLGSKIPFKIQNRPL